jgi:hypothetical protein
MTHVYDNQLIGDDDTVLGTFKTHWQAVAAMIRLSDSTFVSLGGDSKEALEIEREMHKRMKIADEGRTI